MIRCALCNDQVKRDEDDDRLGFDFTPTQLQRSAFEQRCESCLLILEGLRQSEGQDWRWYRDIRRVYAKCLGRRGTVQDTLRLEIYFVDDRPKLELEYYSLQPHPGIPWTKIPRTFQDVIQIALQLGFCYIWIDSLCIIQDDAEDWEDQSAVMSEIYQNAVLTLAATSSEGDHEGCCEKNAQRIAPLEIMLPEDIGACRIAVRKPLHHFDTQNAEGLLTHFPLLTRGWAFQERLLSPRVLHISSACECGGLGQEKSPGGSYHHAVEDSQHEKERYDNTHDEVTRRIGTMRLERASNTRSVSEPTPGTAPDYDSPPAYEAVMSSATRGVSASSNIVFGPQSNDDDIMSFAALSNVPVYEEPTSISEVDIKDCPDLVFHFHRIVEQYSALKLTRPSDRLVALSGLCKRVHHLRNNYLAGLWSDSIGYDLLWRVETISLNTPEKGARSLDYRGPTWSWVSVDSPVTYWTDILNFRPTHHPTHPSQGGSESATLFRSTSSDVTQYTAAGAHASQIAMSLTVPGSNPYGTVTSGILTLSASSKPCILHYISSPAHWLPRRINSTSSTSSAHDPAVRYKLEFTVPSADDGAGPIELPFEADYALSVAGESYVPPNTELMLCLVHPEVCLVLRHAQRSVAPRYVNSVQAWERVGHVRIPRTMVEMYGIDWMRGSEVRKFVIV
ncbi:HET-domain-containing protein [Phaeosphaeriaceae sp. SRC1lsM3a]|nr:HET-domain-containing protein [Stagonospora sp. SRC1lsM3a]